MVMDMQSIEEPFLDKWFKVMELFSFPHIQKLGLVWLCPFDHKSPYSLKYDNSGRYLYMFIKEFRSQVCAVFPDNRVKLRIDLKITE